VAPGAGTRRRPDPGTRNPAHIEQNLEAIDVHLRADDLAELDGLLPRASGAALI
jgi:aryl-alcohol dehydrogenase-like predicted oxidoreductase